ncbi:MAG: flagellar assembly protein FliH [Cellulomonas sp.]|uniref:FliH/SctL family protein n=1 Tax=Cellulomonas sp. TaxID=40001 RepID=UPI002585C621|nr:FliH/SctL family protein [Cellulomonas sp.]MCR6649605.1 flagellar assembly protein FliH [Cellulomonas sp.]MCR6705576.1 flagellar assembly protein FliH [Cellulomonas sp.]
MPDALTLQPLTSTALDAQVHSAARAEGFAAGYAAGARRAAVDAAAAAERVAAASAAAAVEQQEAAARALATLAAAAQAVRALTAPVLAESTATVHAAALELAEAVLGVELADDERSARAALARVLADEPGPGPVTVRLHPSDLATLQHLDAVPEALRLEADPTLHRGDALAHHADGHLDARIGAALDRARDELARVADPTGGTGRAPGRAPGAGA